MTVGTVPYRHVHLSPDFARLSPIVDIPQPDRFREIVSQYLGIMLPVLFLTLEYSSGTFSGQTFSVSYFHLMHSWVPGSQALYDYKFVTTYVGNGIYAQSQVRALRSLGHAVLVISGKPMDSKSSETSNDHLGSDHRIEVIIDNIPSVLYRYCV